jgi:hypothetical protein
MANDELTIMQMEVSPELIRIKREYYERCRKLWEMMRPATSAQIVHGVGFYYPQQFYNQDVIPNLFGGL